MQDESMDGGMDPEANGGVDGATGGGNNGQSEAKRTRMDPGLQEVRAAR